MLDLTNHTMTALLQEMLLRVTEEVNKRDGSLIKTALSACAWVIEGLYIELIEVQQQAYGTTATGEYLDLKAAERGVYRLPAVAAVYHMKADLSTIEVGTEFADASNYTWAISSGVIDGPDEEGLYTYTITCQTAGEIPTPSGELRPLSFVAGLQVADADVVAAALPATADACCRTATKSCDVAASDGDVLALGIVAIAKATADGCRGKAARCHDGSALNADVATARVDSRANSRCRAVAAHVERAVALDGDCLAHGNVDAGIVLVESLHRVCALKDDGGVAQTGEACPQVGIAVLAVDSRIVERHRGTVGNRNLYIGAERSCQHVGVLRHVVFRQRRDVNGVADDYLSHAHIESLSVGGTRSDVLQRVALSHLHT